ncbi:unnamed protein product [Phytophthora fragariaefolia]|uniref:Unnamed protein product n=1 Tax=Phytophthora fragariaefolia TaxID=1490495 RepID=A0A9W6XRR2_9STRA|nr:unnamed protein product [Phytophthora fragariaefolia]
MGKNRFVVNPFGHLPLSEIDRSKLKEFAYDFFDQSVLKYEAFIGEGGPKVDPKEWKLIKTKEDTRVYLERDPPIRTSLSGSVSDHPALLMTGITWGTVEDCMFGAYSPTLETMRIKASYVEDTSGGAVLAVLEEPTPEDPFRSMTIKWIELDLPFNSTSLVKNRDYVYIEYVKTVKMSNGERIGCQIYHSINFPQTKELPNRVRANMTVCGIFRQLGPDTVEVYGSGIVDPAGDMIKAFVVTNGATESVFLWSMCLQQARTMSPMDVINDQMKSSTKDRNLTTASYATIDSSYVSSTTSEHNASSLSEYNG